MSVEELRVRLMELADEWIGCIEGEWSADLTNERTEFERVLDSLIAVARGDMPC